MIKFYLSFLVVLINLTAYSQQFLVSSQYMFNGLILNPAYAGSSEQMSASILHRSQWMGIKGSPSAQLVSMDGPLRKEVGAGINIGNYHTGVTNQTDLSGSLSYNVGKTFSLGMRAGFSYYQSNLSNAAVWDQGDPVFFSDIKSVFLPKVGFGMYYFDGLLYAGLSVPDLLIYDAHKIFTSPDGSVRSLKRNYIFTGGYTHILANNIQLEPSLLIKYHPAYPLVINVNCNVKFNEKFLAGASYRINNAFTGIVQLKVHEKIKLGYAFDIYQPNVKLNYFGTHEIMIAYNLGIDN